MIMPRLIIVRGAPGSGKSTFVKSYIQYLEPQKSYAHFEADMYFEIKGEYLFNPSLLKNAHNWCKEQTEKSMKNLVDCVFVSNTFTKHWEMQAYLNLAKKYNYEVNVYYLKSSYQNVHGVPEEVVQRMISQYEPYEDEEIVY
jgi:predicted kinase